MDLETNASTFLQKILIVDDTPANIEILYKILKGEYDILFAKSGADGIRIARQQLPDLILLDIMMPEMDGYEVCKVLKRDALTAHIPVVFVTAMGSEEDETKGLGMGAIDYITKPISPPIVLARVRNHLELKLKSDLLEKLTRELEGKNRELEILAREDALTHVANRRQFNEMMQAEIQRAMRNERHLSLILCDIDHFKKFNDMYGHLAGDRCLQLLGALMKSCFKRAGELPARYGGEEFAVILPDTSLRQAGEHAERLRRVLLEQALPHAGSDQGVVTISAGVAGARLERWHDIEWFISEADRALYRSKTAGRNRVTLSSECTPEPGRSHEEQGETGQPEHDAAQPGGDRA